MSDKHRHRSRSRDKSSRHNERERSPHREHTNYNEYPSNRQQSYGKYDSHRDRQSHNRSKQSRQYNERSSHRQSGRQSKQFKQRQPKKDQDRPQQQTKMICIQDIDSRFLSQLQRKLTDTSISVGTSVPDEVQIKQNMAIIKYPSVQVSTSIFNFLQGFISLSGQQWQLRYFPLSKSDINISYDWYCDKCEYKNFARRGKCHRCDNQRNPNCRLNYGSQFVSFNNASKKQEIQDEKNCSLMIRGQVVTQIQQELLLGLFQGFAPIKDIRMIRNKITGGNKDFAFVQFYSPEQAAFALKKTNSSDFRVAGQRVTVMYSRTKQDDQFFARPYDKDRRGPPPPLRPLSKLSEDTPNYYLRQRQLQIQQQKKRPLITLQQLKQKRQLQLKKTLPQQKQMNQEQSQRKKAQMLAKQWQKQIKQQTAVIYICPLCKRKFKNDDQMTMHSKYSELHKFRLARLQKDSLSL